MTDFKRITDEYFVKQKLDYRKIHYWSNLKSGIYHKYEENVNCIRFCQTSNRYAVSSGFEVEIRDAAVNNVVVKNLHKFKSPVRSLAYRPDGGLLCVAETNAKLSVFNAESRAELRKLLGHKAPPTACDFLPGVSQLVSSADDGHCMLWDVATGDLVRDYSLSSADKATALAVSASDCNLITCGLSNGSAIVLDARQDKPVLTLDNQYCVTALRLSPADNALYVAGDCWVRAYSLHQAGKHIAAFKRHHKHVTSLCVNAQFGSLLSAGLDGLVKVTDLLTYEEVYKFEYPNCALLAMGISSDAQHMSIGSADNWLLTRKYQPAQQQQQQQRQLKRKRIIDPYLKAVKADKILPPRVEDRVDDRQQQQQQKLQFSQLDKFFKSFRHSDALTHLLNSNALKQRPQQAIAAIRELQHRGALATALAGRQQADIARIVKFTLQSMGNQQFVLDVLPLAADLIDIYATSLAQYPSLQPLFLRLRALLARELTLAHNMLPTIGRISLLLDCSTAAAGAVSAAL